MRVNLLQWTRTHTLYLYSHLPAPAGAITPQGKETHVEGTIDTVTPCEPIDSYDTTVKLYRALVEAGKITDTDEAYAYLVNPQAYRPALEKLIALGGFAIVPSAGNGSDEAWAEYREWTRNFEAAVETAGAAS